MSKELVRLQLLLMSEDFLQKVVILLRVKNADLYVIIWHLEANLKKNLL